MAGTKRGRDKSPKASPKVTAKKAAADPDAAELKERYAASLAKSKQMFIENRTQKLTVDLASSTLKKETKRYSDYGAVLNQNAQIITGQGKGATAAAAAMLTAGDSASQLMLTGPGQEGAVTTGLEDKGLAAEIRDEAKARISKAFADPESEEANTPLEKKEFAMVPVGQKPGVNTLSLKTKKKIEPEWHAPWKMMRVISGHQGWVRSVEVEPGNEWFATGASDACVKIWDMASGALKLTLTGHISCIRGIQVSKRSPYMFTVSEDKTVKCWDLEYNKVVRHYHGHLSGVFSVALHPDLDVLCTGGRDCAVRLWDIRTESQIHCLTGHNDAVCDIKCQSAEPQIISGSMDNTIKLWDIVGGRARSTLTNHKKSIRSLAVHPRDYTFCSGAADNIKQWKCPEGKFIQNITGHNAIVNTVAVNHENVLFSGGDNGSMKFFDWRTGYCFQDMETVAQPGSLESEAGIFSSTFDQTGSRLITCEADKTIKIWKEDETATPETHPINYKEVGNKKQW